MPENRCVSWFQSRNAGASILRRYDSNKYLYSLSGQYAQHCNAQKLDGDGSADAITMTSPGKYCGTSHKSRSVSQQPTYSTPFLPLPPLIHKGSTSTADGSESSCWYKISYLSGVCALICRIFRHGSLRGYNKHPSGYAGASKPCNCSHLSS